MPTFNMLLIVSMLSLSQIFVGMLSKCAVISIFAGWNPPLSKASRSFESVNHSPEIGK
jgi:hypothetical protein